MEAQNSPESVISRHESKSFNNNLATSTSTLACAQKNIHGPNTGGSFGNPNSNSRFGTIQSTSTVDTYYIYSFDGKLMAEYDNDGNCVKDYIYAGNRLIAEYQPQANKYYYYMSDQINSTRIITDDNGNVVYSEAYGPFGGVQKNWTKVYDPKLKFSGKEREAYGDLDYFGARYYDHDSYRFISVDPIINKKEALANPQLWNLYAYCRSNPITYLDADGRISESMGKYEYTVAEHLGKASNDPVSTFVAQLIVEEVAFVAVSGGVITAARWAKRLKWLGKILNSASKIKKSFSIVSRVFKNPAKFLKGKNPEQISKLVNKFKKAGWIEGKLGKGAHKGQGFILRETTESGKLTGRMIQYHPGGGHHGANSYWKVSTPESGTIRIFN